MRTLGAAMLALLVTSHASAQAPAMPGPAELTFNDQFDRTARLAAAEAGIVLFVTSAPTGESVAVHASDQTLLEDVGKDVVLLGWVHRVRDLGSLIFLDVRDRYGVTKVVARVDEREPCFTLCDRRATRRGRRFSHADTVRLRGDALFGHVW